MIFDKNILQSIIFALSFATKHLFIDFLHYCCIILFWGFLAGLLRNKEKKETENRVTARKRINLLMIQCHSHQHQQQCADARSTAGIYEDIHAYISSQCQRHFD